MAKWIKISMKKSGIIFNIPERRGEFFSKKIEISNFCLNAYTHFIYF